MLPSSPGTSGVHLAERLLDVLGVGVTEQRGEADEPGGMGVEEVGEVVALHAGWPPSPPPP